MRPVTRHSQDRSFGYRMLRYSRTPAYFVYASGDGREMVHQALAVAIRADDVRYIEQGFVPGDQIQGRLFDPDDAMDSLCDFASQA